MARRRIQLSASWLGRVVPLSPDGVTAASMRYGRDVDHMRSLLVARWQEGAMEGGREMLGGKETKGKEKVE